jgi:hypothetical protein
MVPRLAPGRKHSPAGPAPLTSRTRRRAASRAGRPVSAVPPGAPGPAPRQHRAPGRPARPRTRYSRSSSQRAITAESGCTPR